MKQKVYSRSFALLFTFLIFLMALCETELYATGNLSNTPADINAIQNAYNNGNYSRVIQLVQQSRQRTQQISVDKLFYEGASFYQLRRYESAKTSLNEFLNRASVNHNRTKDTVITLNQIQLHDARDDLAFSQASTLFGYEQYIRNFPNGKHVAEARQRIRNIEYREQIARLESRIESSEFAIQRAKSRRNSELVSGFLWTGLAMAGVGALSFYEDNDDDLILILAIPAIVVGLKGGYDGFKDASSQANRIRSLQNDKQRYERELRNLQSRASLLIHPTYIVEHKIPGIRLTLNF